MEEMKGWLAELESSGSQLVAGAQRLETHRIAVFEAITEIDLTSDCAANTRDLEKRLNINTENAMSDSIRRIEQQSASENADTLAALKATFRDFHDTVRRKAADWTRIYESMADRNKRARYVLGVVETTMLKIFDLAREADRLHGDVAATALGSDLAGNAAASGGGPRALDAVAPAVSRSSGVRRPFFAPAARDSPVATEARGQSAAPQLLLQTTSREPSHSGVRPPLQRQSSDTSKDSLPLSSDHPAWRRLQRQSFGGILALDREPSLRNQRQIEPRPAAAPSSARPASPTTMFLKTRKQPAPPPTSRPRFFQYNANPPIALPPPSAFEALSQARPVTFAALASSSASSSSSSSSSSQPPTNSK